MVKCNAAKFKNEMLFMQAYY